MGVVTKTLAASFGRFSTLNLDALWNWWFGESLSYISITNVCSYKPIRRNVLAGTVFVFPMNVYVWWKYCAVIKGNCIVFMWYES